MKKTLVVVLVAAVLIGLFVWGTHYRNEKILKGIYFEVDESLSYFAQNMMEKEHFAFAFKSLTYEITDIRSQVSDLRYIVAVTWYADVELDEYFSVGDVRGYITTLLEGALPFQVTVEGKSRSLTHMDKTLGDNLTVVINGSGAYTGADHFNEVVGDKDGDQDHYPGGTCPRCGVGYSANTTFARMVKKHGYCGRGRCGK